MLSLNILVLIDRGAMATKAVPHDLMATMANTLFPSIEVIM